MRAIALAERGRGSTAPNPVVGCVVVRDGVVVGEGWHERPGGPHAEVVALERAGADARAATVYVTLEPCTHHGRTPPCTDSLIAAGVGRVVYGLADPDPLAAGGHRVLEAAGIPVTAGVAAERCREQNRVFVHTRTHGLPFVTLKLAQTLDGSLSVPGTRWVTGVAARRRVHGLRAESDAVLVGVGTVLADDPSLDVRHVDAPVGRPHAVVVDSTGRTPVGARVVRPGTVVVTTERAPQAWRRGVARGGAEVVEVGVDAGRVDVTEALRVLLGRGLRTVLAEPGPRLATTLVRGGLVSRLVLHVAVGRVGRSAGLPAAPDCVREPAAADWRWRTARLRRLGDDVEVVAEPVTAEEI